MAKFDSSYFNIDEKPWEYINEEVLPKPKYTLRRFNSDFSGKKRYYYELIGKTPVLYSSLTTLIDSAYKEDFNALEKWRRQIIAEGKDPDKIAADRANYGTVMHVVYVNYLLGHKIPIHPTRLIEYLRTQELGVDIFAIEKLISYDLEELSKDLLSFAQWVKDYNVKPLAAELMLRSVEHGVATPIDLICTLDVDVMGDWGEVYKSGDKKGTPKLTKQKLRVNAIIDFKSGKKGFYDKHVLQLGIGHIIFKENYPNIPIDYIFNFSPSDWISQPTYNFKDQTNSNVLQYVHDVLSMGKKKFKNKTKEIKIFDGDININDEFISEDYFTISTVEEILEQSHTPEPKSKPLKKKTSK